MTSDPNLPLGFPTNHSGRLHIASRLHHASLQTLLRVPNHSETIASYIVWPANRTPGMVALHLATTSEPSLWKYSDTKDSFSALSIKITGLFEATPVEVGTRHN